MKLQNLTPEDIRLGLTDLLEDRADALRQISSGELYHQLLKDRLAELVTTTATPSGRSLAEEMAFVDARHDALGRAVWFYTGAYLENPLISADVRIAAARVRKEFIPFLDELRSSYADEAAKALRRKQSLPLLAADLRKFPTAEDKTLYDWVDAFLDEGENLFKLLQEKNASKGDHKARAAAKAIQQLERLRGTLQDEVEFNRELPRDLDAQIFGFFDELSSQRGRAEAESETQEEVA